MDSSATHDAKKPSALYWLVKVCEAAKDDQRGGLAEKRERNLQKGRVIYSAHQTLEHGEWTRLWRMPGAPFSKRKGEKFVVIGREFGKWDATNCSQLPAAWTSLYLLGQLGQTLVLELIGEKAVTPLMKIREAEALLAKYKPRHQPNRPQVKLRVQKFFAFIRQTMPAWTSEERLWAHRELLNAVAEVRLSNTDTNPSSRLPLKRSYPEHTLPASI